MASPAKLSVLSFNIGLLDYYIPGIGVVYCYPAFAENRLHHIPEAVRRANADVVCFQEAYTSSQISTLVNSLSDIYPFHAQVSSPGWWKLQNGMLTFSKYPIISQHLEHFETVSTLESWFCNKALLAVTVSIPNVGNIGIINIHTTAGGPLLPTHPLSDIDRAAEFEQVIRCVRHLESAGCHAIVAGDYNCGPYSSEGNWTEFRQKYNFRDMFCEALENNCWWSENGEPYTWDPKNVLNQMGPHKELPSDRLDHIMLNGNDVFWNKWKLTSAKILFTDECVSTSHPDITKTTLSDHFGLFCEIESNDLA